MAHPLLILAAVGLAGAAFFMTRKSDYKVERDLLKHFYDEFGDNINNEHHALCAEQLVEAGVGNWTQIHKALSSLSKQSLLAVQLQSTAPFYRLTEKGLRQAKDT